MSNYTVRGLPPIKLMDLLRKRRTSLKDFLKNSGIVSYNTLLSMCNNMGVAPPEEEVFKNSIGDNYSSPQEGVIVLDPPRLVKDSGEKIQVDSFAGFDQLLSEEDTQQKEEEVEVNNVPVKYYSKSKNKKGS